MDTDEKPHQQPSEPVAPKIKEHTWEVETLDYGQKDEKKFGKFWICKVCASAGGPVVGTSRPKPFLSGTPLRNVGDDCDVAKATIDEFVKMYPDWLEYVTRHRAV